MSGVVSACGTGAYELLERAEWCPRLDGMFHSAEYDSNLMQSVDRLKQAADRMGSILSGAME